MFGHIATYAENLETRWIIVFGKPFVNHVPTRSIDCFAMCIPVVVDMINAKEWFEVFPTVSTVWTIMFYRSEPHLASSLPSPFVVIIITLAALFAIVFGRFSATDADVLCFVSFVSAVTTISMFCPARIVAIIVAANTLVSVEFNRRFFAANTANSTVSGWHTIYLHDHTNRHTRPKRCLR